MRMLSSYCGAVSRLIANCDELRVGIDNYPAYWHLKVSLNEFFRYTSAPEDTKLCDAAGDPVRSIRHRIVPGRRLVSVSTLDLLDYLPGVQQAF